MAAKLHVKNKHKTGYNLKALCEVYPELNTFVFENEHKNTTLNFANPKAVKALNTALLYKYYNIKFWGFPDDNLCPPIPGRVDYVHYLNDILRPKNNGDSVKVLDIGTGATCIYPLLGNAVYKWQFVATDIDKVSLQNAQLIIDKNNLNAHIELRHQKNKLHILKGVLNETDSFLVSMCNPPFYTSEQEAIDATKRKLKGLDIAVENKPVRNFSGTHNELWYKGGEKAFLHNYLYESSLFKAQCVWFSSLVSKKDLIRGLKVSLKKLGATSIKVINMETGNKTVRFIAWSFQE